MLKNYLTIVLRTLRRHAGYAFINLFGLAVGTACCLLILLYVRQESTYDRHHTHADRIYRLALDVESADATGHAAVSALPFGPALQADFPEVEAYVRFHKVTTLLQHEGRRDYEDDVLYADASLFDVFTLPLAAGDPATALAAPYSMVLTEAVARRYFGHTNVVGQTMMVDGDDLYTITGILAEGPNTHLPLGVLLSLSTWMAQNPDRTQNWTWHNFYTYLLLPAGYDPARLEAKLPDFVARHTDGLAEERGVTYHFPLQALPDLYLHSGREAEIGKTGDPSRLYVFSALAVMILLVACINFMNLATARSTRRAREVGLRKVLGAERGQLFRQFMSESILLSSLALVLALGLCALLLPGFSALVGTHLPFSQLFGGPFPLLLGALALGVGVFAGSYPALVLSGFQPLRVLKGSFRATAQGALLRKGLVVVQFAVSILLIAGTAVVYAQLDFLRQQDLGFDKEQILVVDFRNDPNVVTHYEAIKQAFAVHPAVRAAAASDFVPGSDHGAIWVQVDQGDGTQREDVFAYGLIDHDFLDAYGIGLAAGRGFSRAFSSDETAAFLINEAAARRLGWTAPEDALGKTVRQWGRVGEIVGVVEDFHYTSLHQAVEPLFLHIRPSWFRRLSLRVDTDALAATMADLERIWQQQVPERPFDYAFLDESFDRQYQADARFGQLFGAFAGLAIVVACLGLFGLAAFTAEQRTKEIGVRKVLGARVSQLVVLLGSEFARPVLLAFAVAAPAAYIVLQRWLDGFAYHIDVPLGLLLLAGLVTFFVAALSVSYQSVKAALADPVNTLRYE